ncbi:hypothetical protein G6F61_009796 [Rhizopus arrhizus]|nr:hypothetical protein G6F61_009796 [Rhizopus arrhizus]
MSDNNKIVKNIVFQIIHVHNGNWKDDNYWQYLDIASACLKAWLDCDKLEFTEAIMNELLNLLSSSELSVSEAFLSLTQLRCLSRCYLYKADYNSRKEDWLKVNQYLLKSKDLIQRLEDDARDDYTNYLYHLSINIGFQLVKTNKKSADILHWIANYNLFHNNNYSIYLEKCFLELVVQSCQKDKLCANEKDLNVIIGLLNKTKLKNDLEYCFAKLCILVKYSSVNKMMIQTGSITMTNTQLGYIIHGIFPHVSFANIMDGLDLLIHRHHTNEDVSNSTLYLFKFYMLCELALEYTSIECYKTTLQAALDGLYLATESIDSIDMASIQLLLWKNGDYFYRKKDYINAIPWYFHTSSILNTTQEGQRNMLVLSRKLAISYAETNDYVLAAECLEKAIDHNNVCTEDMLLLVRWSIEKNDTISSSIS